VSSPITLSGFNDIDFGSIITSLMAQASQPLTALQTRQKSLQSQVSSYESLATYVETLRGAADKLSRPENLRTLAGTSSESYVSVGIDASATAGHYDVIVNEIARAQVTVSASSAPDANSTIVAQGGSLTIGGVAVSIAGDVTLQQLADTINATSGIGVTATVIRSGNAAYRLALSSTQTGQAQAFTVTNGMTGGAGVTFTDTDNNGITGDSAADNAVTATDASILINNVVATSSSNTFDQIVSGVSLTVSKKDPLTTVSVDVATDTSAVKDTVKAFVAAYNDFAKFVSDQRSSAAGGNASSIAREPTLRQLHNSMRSMLIGAYGAGPLTRLAEAGIELTSTGQLKLNESVFDQAIATNAADVTTLFTSATGAFTGIESTLDLYAQVDGLIPESKKRLESQIALMDSQIEAMQLRLSIEREGLQKQFAEADAIMSRLKSQAASLTNFSTSFGSNS
jgi:flagellar hook-associated protein 2